MSEEKLVSTVIIILYLVSEMGADYSCFSTTSFRF